MNSRKIVLLFILVLTAFMPFQAKSQYSEAGILLGGSTYKGELSHSLFSTKFLHPAIGIFYRHNWNRHWSYRFGANLGKISGDDAESNNAYEVNRNLSFFSTLWEVNGMFEFNFFPYETGQDGFRFTPYMHTGLSLFHFNPKAEFNGETYELQPLATEGQDLDGSDSYGRLKLAFIIGGGLKFSVGPIGIGLEVTTRKAYTDYVDDVSTVYPDMVALTSAHGAVAAELSDRSLLSPDPATTIYPGKQRGNPEDNDWYLFSGITLYVRLNSLVKDSCLPFKARRY